MAYLKERQEYVDRYDKATVNDCRWHEDFHLGYAKKQKVKNEKEREAIHGISEYAWSIEKIFLTLHWYDKKEATIQKWMDEDARRDERLENARPPENIFCDECYGRMQFSDKHLWDLDDTDRILFFFDCPNNCKKRKAIYDDGTLYVPKPHLCEKCKHEVEIAREHVSNYEIKHTYTCPSCSHVEVDTLDFTPREEPEDPKYEYDRNRFCLSGKELQDAQESRRNFESLKELMEKLEHKEENKELYDKAEQIEKLTVPQVKEHITTALEKQSYTNITFEKPDLGRIVSLEFSIEEMETDNERASVLKLKTLLKNLLQNTNWRLMTEGISYRLGVLTGRLRVYESEEELVKLIEKK